jgi:hypothetical protein
MSWEEFPPEIKPCWCGKSTITYIMEMDGWNRTRTSRIINCQECLEKDLFEEQEKSRKKELREKLHNKAKNLAADRYLDAWIEKFEGLNKKQAWEALSNKSGYPSLGTFYKHTKDEGMLKYIKRQFEQDFEACLEKLGLSDENITSIINERDNI